MVYSAYGDLGGLLLFYPYYGKNKHNMDDIWCPQFRKPPYIGVTDKICRRLK